MKLFLSAIAAALLLATTPAGIARAQATTSVLSGMVTDDRGVPAPDVKVEIENVNTGRRMSATTDTNGAYRFDDVPVGRYRVITTSGRVGSSPSREIDVSLGSGGNVLLTIGGPDSKSTDGAVTAQPVPVTTRPAQIATDFNNQYGQYLTQPNFLSRNGEASGAYNLGILPSGVTSGSLFQVGQGPAVTGSRPVSNNYHIDGSDNNNRLVPGQLLYLPNEATNEFALFENQSEPVFGHSTGGQFNSIVRSGTSQFHGAVYDYLQNRNLNAIDKSFSRVGIRENPKYDQNRLGGSVGFPILPGKLFFFGNFEYIPFGFENPLGSITYAPTTGGFAALAGTPGVSATNLGILRAAAGTVTPVPGLATAVGTTTVPLGYISTFARGFQNQFVGAGALDWTLSSSDQLRFRYVHNDLDARTGNTLPAFETPYQRRSFLASAGWYKSFTASLTNDLRLSYNRFNNEAQPAVGSTYFPSIAIQDVGLTLGPQYGPAAYAGLNTYQLEDNVRWSFRGHTLHLGFDGRRAIGTESGFATGAGVYGYSNLGRFLFDLAPDVTSMRTFGTDSYSNNFWTLFPYITDTWQMRPNLSINLGLGWQYATIPSGIKLQALNSAVTVPGTLNFAEPDTQKHNFAPQVGFAWSPQMKRSTVVRAGFGMSYDTLQGIEYLGPAAPQIGATIMPDLRSGAPFFLAGGGIRNPYPPTPAGTTGLAPLTPAAYRALTSTYYGNQQVPYNMQWNVAVQQAIWRNMTAEVKYMGTRLVHESRYARLNETSPVTATAGLPIYLTPPTPAALASLIATAGSLAAAPVRPLAPLGFTSPITTMLQDGSGMYHGLGVTLNQRFRGGFQLLGNYTWSHLIDDSTGTPLDLAFPLERGNSLFDRRHRATVTGLFDVAPLFKNTYSIVRNVFANVTLSGTYMYESPQYLPVLSGLNAGLTGSSFSSAMFIPGATGPMTGSGVVPLTNATGATVAYLATNPGAAFIRPGIGAYATGPRAAFPLDNTNNFDIAVVKRFAWRERFGFEVRGEAYNIFNHSQFTGTNIHNLNGPSPNAVSSFNSFASFLLPGNAEFGNLAGAMTSHPRLLQVALRATF